MAEDWTHVRVRRATAERIRERIEEMRAEYYLGHQSRTPVESGELSVDGLLNWLLDERVRHRERARRGRASTKPVERLEDQTRDGLED